MIYLPYTKRAMAQTIALEGMISCSVFRFRKLRHTYAVMAIQSGDDMKTVQENLGHAAAFTLDVYGHVTAQVKKTGADRMEQKIQAVSGL